MDALIVGLGNIGLMYDINENKRTFIRTHSKALYCSKYFTKIGVVDTNQSKINLAKKKYNFKLFKKIPNALKEIKPHLVIISSETKNHYKNFKEIIKYHIPKIVLIEKPISNDIKKIKKILNICKKKRIKLFTNFIRRSEPSVISIKKKVLKGYYEGCIYYNKGFLNNGSHWINLLEYFFGKVQNFKICYSKKIGFDKNISVKLIFKKSSIFLLYKKNDKNTNYMQINSKFNKINYLNAGKKIFYKRNIDGKIKKIKNSMNKYQLNVLNEIIKVFKKNKEYNLCGQKEALSNFKTIFRIYNTKI